MISPHSNVPRVRLGPTDAFMCTQLSPDWFELRRGIATASNFDRIMTLAKRKYSAAAEGYIDELIAERFVLDPNAMTETPMSAAMRHGVACEPEARSWYEIHTGQTAQQVGFCIDAQERFGCSPDALVGEVGVLELKVPQGKTHVGYLRAGTLPSEYACQVHGHLLVTGRQWCDFVSYCPGLNPFIVRVTPDDFTAALTVCLEQFWAQFQETLAKIGGL